MGLTTELEGTDNCKAAIKEACGEAKTSAKDQVSMFENQSVDYPNSKRQQFALHAFF
jgi:hypothetical protein